MSTPAFPSQAEPMVDRTGRVSRVWQLWLNSIALKLDAAAPVSGLARVATSGSYADLTNKPVLGTAAAANVEDFATTAQGAKADNAVPNTRQVATVPGDLTGGGDLTINRAIGLAPTSVTAGNYGGRRSVSTFTVDAKGRLTAASGVAIGDTVGTVATDADFTWTFGASPSITRHTGTLTADRAVILVAGVAQNGDRARFARSGSGAFNLSIGGLKNLATNTWAEIVFDGTAWQLIGYGSL